MDDFLPDDIRELRDAFVSFLQRQIAPALAAHQAAGSFPRELIRQTGEAGWFGVLFPQALGGSDVGFLAMAVIAEELARFDPGFALCHNPQGGTCPYTIFAGGSDAQCGRFIPGLVAGRTIGMWALTESGGGSDAAGNLKTFAERRGDRYVINGRKMFATLADETDTGALLARTDRDAGHRGISAFVVEPRKYPGFAARPVENRLGAEGDGLGRQWGQLCRAIGRPQLTDDPRLVDNAARVENLAEMLAIIEGWLARMGDDAKAIRLLEVERVPVAPVLSVQEVMRLPHVRQRRTVRTLMDRALGEFDVPGVPLRFSAFPDELPLDAPFLGEHNQDVPGASPDYDTARIAALEAEGVLCARQV
jgi:hypothetical protein